MTAYFSIIRAAARLRWSAACLLAAFVFTSVAHAQTADAAGSANSLESVSVAKGASGRTVVKFTLKQAPANPPAGFAIASPPRIALDFLDTANNLGTAPRAVEDGALRGLNVIQAGNRTRVVFNLNRPQNFETQVEGNAVLVTLLDQAGGTADVQTPQVQRFAEARTSDIQHAIRDVDFRRGKTGEGRIIVDLSDNTTGIDIRQQGSQLIVDFLRTSVPRNLERRLDVGDFGACRRHPRPQRHRHRTAQ